MDAVVLNIPFFSSDEAGANAIEAAKGAKIKFIVWNTSGKIPTAPSPSRGLNIRRKNALLLKESGIPYIILQPTIFLENLLLTDTTAKMIAEEDCISYPTPIKFKTPWMSTIDLASFITAAIERPELAGSSFVPPTNRVVNSKASTFLKSQIN